MSELTERLSRAADGAEAYATSLHEILSEAADRIGFLEAQEMNTATYWDKATEDAWRSGYEQGRDEAADRIEQLETAEFIGRLPDYVKELEAEVERLHERNDELVDALAPMIERCRHDIGVDRCHQPAIVIVWGKLAKPDEFGPKCIDHAPKWWDSSRPDQYAAVDLRPALRALRSEP